MGDAFTDYKTLSKVYLMYLEFKLQYASCDWCVCKLKFHEILRICIQKPLLISKKIILILISGVPKFPLDINRVLLLDKFIEQNKLRPILIKIYEEFEKNIEMLVFHQTLLMELSTIKKSRRNLYTWMAF